MTTKQIRTIFLVIIILILFILVFLIFKPFLNLILWGILLSVIINPIYKKFINKKNKLTNNYFYRGTIAAILSFLTILIIVVPVFFILYRLAIELKQFSLWLENLRESAVLIDFEKINNLIQDIIYKISGINIQFDLASEISKILANKKLDLAPIITSLASKILNTIIGLFFLVITIYFILTDSSILIKYFEDIIPIEKKYIDNFSFKFRQVMEVIVKGYLIIGLYQAFIIFILLIIFKHSNPFLFSTLTFISSFIPMLGASVIWLPIAILIGFTQGIVKGVIFALLAGFFVSTVDNFLRPLIISDKIKIHPLLLFFSIIGGLMAFGYNGVILGPLFLALLYSSLEIIKSNLE